MSAGRATIRNDGGVRVAEGNHSHEEDAMAHFLIRASYTPEGLQGVLKEGAASRLDAVQKLASSLGGSVEAAYWAFGEDDFISILELPDNAAAAAAASTVSASGAVKITTVVLLTAADVDEARSRSASYRPPGA
jgi:uncharacterized protein with GYD domain